MGVLIIAWVTMVGVVNVAVMTKIIAMQADTIKIISRLGGNRDA